MEEMTSENNIRTTAKIHDEGVGGLYLTLTNNTDKKHLCAHRIIGGTNDKFKSFETAVDIIRHKCKADFCIPTPLDYYENQNI